MIGNRRERGLALKELLSKPIWRVITMTIATKISNRRRVLNHLASGKTLTSKQARTKFGVKNFRAMISDIRSQVEAFGNWEITTSVRNGETVYGMNDTYVGDRVYGFAKDGSRYLINA